MSGKMLPKWVIIIKSDHVPARQRRAALNQLPLLLLLRFHWASSEIVMVTGVVGRTTRLTLTCLTGNQINALSSNERTRSKRMDWVASTRYI